MFLIQMRGFTVASFVFGVFLGKPEIDPLSQGSELCVRSTQRNGARRHWLLRRQSCRIFYLVHESCDEGLIVQFLRFRWGVYYMFYRQITINWYKPFPHGWFMIVFTIIHFVYEMICIFCVSWANGCYGFEAADQTSQRPIGAPMV